MQCFEFETRRRWFAARLRSQGASVRDQDDEIVNLLEDAGLTTLQDVIRLTDEQTLALAERAGLSPLQAA